MSVNVPLLRKAVEWVEEQALLPMHLREWDQAHWCGTRCCVAGWVALHEGWSRTKLESVVTKDGRSRTVDEVASKALGLTEPQAIGLFLGTIVEDEDFKVDAWHTATEVRRVAEEIAGEPL